MKALIINIRLVEDMEEHLRTMDTTEVGIVPVGIDPDWAAMPETVAYEAERMTKRLLDKGMPK
jgi:hypothetical protein